MLILNESGFASLNSEMIFLFSFSQAKGFDVYVWRKKDWMVVDASNCKFYLADVIVTVSGVQVHISCQR